MLIDLHSHSTLSDGTLSIAEMVAAAERRGYAAYALTDHAHGNDLSYADIVTAVRDEVERLISHTGMHLFAGVELTDFPPHLIPQAARRARRAGAQVVVVHGECLMLNVPPGTNAAAVRCPEVDILAHPGLLGPEDAEAAAAHDVYVEISARHGHDYANGHVYRLARRFGARVIVDSDAHDESGLLSDAQATALLRGAGAPITYVTAYQVDMAPALLQQLLKRTAHTVVR